MPTEEIILILRNVLGGSQKMETSVVFFEEVEN